MPLRHLASRGCLRTQFVYAALDHDFSSKHGVMSLPGDLNASRALGCVCRKCYVPGLTELTEDEPGSRQRLPPW